ncbi:hypothetical protein OROGR_011200 [Orobanche gracilis]
MEHKHKLILIIVLASITIFAVFSLSVFCLLKGKAKSVSTGIIQFQGGENLSVQEILEAPGDVIGKSSYGTLYRACLADSNSLTLLRFLRPTCTLRIKEVMPIVELLRSIRHPNLVPLIAFMPGLKGRN